MKSRKEHWNHVYSTKQPYEVSWTEEKPSTSLKFIRGFNLSREARIIDIGGGDSRLVDYLLDEGFQNITVLDISDKAIEKAKERLGKKAVNVTWIVSDILDFTPAISYDCWHDRATFHFLTTNTEVNSYLETARKAVNQFMVIGTFSEEGPKKCSLLDVQQYSEEELQARISDGFRRIKCIKENHITPFNTVQNFLFCSFKKLIS